MFTVITNFDIFLYIPFKRRDTGINPQRLLDATIKILQIGNILLSAVSFRFSKDIL